MEGLRRMRIAAGVSVKELASYLGVSIMSIYRYEVGARTPDVELAAKMASYLHCSIDDLLQKAG